MGKKIKMAIGAGALLGAALAILVVALFGQSLGLANRAEVAALSRNLDTVQRNNEALVARIATLEVRESNIRARTLYETFGFRQIARRKGYYPRSGEDAIVMLLELGKGPQPGRTAGRESGNEIR